MPDVSTDASALIGFGARIQLGGCQASELILGVESEPVTLDHEDARELAAFLKSEMDKWGPVIRDAKIKADE